MANFKLIISYNGEHYFGWQKTHSGPSIEECLEKALFKILKEKISLQAASRTDRAVHAEGQVVNFCTQKELDLKRLQLSLNGTLPPDIKVKEIHLMQQDFHPTLDCIAKEYHYFLCTGRVQLPFHRQFSWHFPYFLDLAKMQEAAASLIGLHDFSSFSNQKVNDAMREIYRITLIPLDNRLKIEIVGSHFLYKMVRNIVGSLVYVGCGKLNSISDILTSKDRKQAGPTAPACGLFLKQVYYSIDEMLSFFAKNPQESAMMAKNICR